MWYNLTTWLSQNYNVPNNMGQVFYLLCPRQCNINTCNILRVFMFVKISSLPHMLAQVFQAFPQFMREKCGVITWYYIYIYILYIYRVHCTYTYYIEILLIDKQHTWLAVLYRVSINSFPDYKHLLQENFMLYLS